MSKIDSLTSLRFFAAWSIVFYHMQGGILPLQSMPQFALGVSFFFVLSGFILSFIYNNMACIDMPRFYLNRVARVWPVHIFTMLLVMVVFEPVTSGTVVLLNAFLLHAWTSNSMAVFSMNPVSWSISAELAFYLAFPALVMFKPVWRAVSVVVILVSLFLLGLASTKIPIAAPVLWASSQEIFVVLSPFVRILEFAVGVMAGDLFVRKGPSSKVNGTFRELIVLAMLAAYCVSNSFISSWIATVSPVLSIWYGQSGGVLIFAALIYVLASESGAISNFLRGKPFVLLGEISFCTYMIHYPVILLCQKFGWADLAPWPIVALWVVGATLVGSLIIWYFVELPARNFIVGLYEPVSRISRNFFRTRAQAD